MVEAIVEYDYIAQEPDELTIHKGDIINNINKKQGGWWEGTLRDKRGMFPDNFVQVIHKDSVTLRSKSSKVRQCRAVFSYHPAHDDELSLAVGDIIDVLGEVEEGWWKGRLGNTEGVFPCNFVAEIDGEKSHSKSSSKEDLTSLASENDSSTPNLPPKPTKILCQAKYPYDACNDDELTLREGDLITLISKTGQDRGWWRGELRGQVGVFPDNFVVILSKHTEDGQAKPEKGGDKPSLNKLSLSPQAADEAPKSNVASQRKSLEIKSEDRAVPPVPGKKPSVPKKSPVAVAVTGTGAGALAELKQKLADRVDGAAGSRMSRPEDGELEFDQVERSAMLPDMRANRAKKPAGRRPPSVIYRDSEQPSLVNGSADQPLACMSETSNDEDEAERKPKVREWEKHKAPWVEELKLNQAKRTTPPLTPASAPDAPDPGRDAASPVDMSRSLSSLGAKLRTPPSDAAGVLFRAKSLAGQPGAAATPPRPQSIHGVASPAAEPARLAPAPAAATTSLTPSPVAKPPIAEKNIDPKSVPRSSLERKSDTVSLKHYLELAERVAGLEARMQQQFQDMQATIGELRSKLQLETELRVLLQLELEKVAQCVTQV